MTAPFESATSRAAETAEPRGASKKLPLRRWLLVWSGALALALAIDVSTLQLLTGGSRATPPAFVTADFAPSEAEPTDAASAWTPAPDARISAALKADLLSQAPRGAASIVGFAAGSLQAAQDLQETLGWFAHMGLDTRLIEVASLPRNGRMGADAAGATFNPIWAAGHRRGAALVAETRLPSLALRAETAAGRLPTTLASTMSADVAVAPRAPRVGAVLDEAPVALAPASGAPTSSGPTAGAPTAGSSMADAPVTAPVSSDPWSMAADESAAFGLEVADVALETTPKVDPAIIPERAAEAVLAAAARFEAPAPARPAPVRASVFFGFRMTGLTDAAQTTVATGLDAFLAEAGPEAQVLVEVVGHADTAGPSLVNDAVAERRAAAVADFIAARYGDRVVIRRASYGETRPAVATGDEVRDGRNRRVELTFSLIEQL